LVTSCSDVVAFFKSSETDPAIGLVLIAIGVEPEYRSVARSLSGWSPKGEPNVPENCLEGGEYTIKSETHLI
jgi:hypothetical protein